MIHDEHNTSIRQVALDRLLWVTDVLSADMARGLTERGLTQARAHLLWELGTRRPKNQRELAGILDVTPRNVTTLLDSLERTGFVRRSSHPTDRRSTLVELTEQGEAAVAALRADRDRLAEFLFRELSDDDLGTFSRVAHQAATRLQASPCGAHMQHHIQLTGGPSAPGSSCGG